MEKLGILGALVRGAGAALPYAKSALRPAWHFAKGLVGKSAPSVANTVGKGVGLTTSAVAPTAMAGVGSYYGVQEAAPLAGNAIGKAIGNSEQVGQHLDRISSSIGQAANEVGGAASGVNALTRPFIGEDGKPNWLQGLLQSSGSAGQFFQNNKNWLIPSLISGLGLGGGYMLGGGTGAALGGIGLPLLYALFQNRDQLGLGGSPSAARQTTPPTTAPAAPPTVPTAPAAPPAATQGNTGTIYDTYRQPAVAQQPQPAQSEQFQPMPNEMQRQKTMQQPGQ
jgi:hypothetical protein